MERFSLMLMTRDPGIAAVAQACGIDRIFVDLEMRGKAERQRGHATIISGHTIDDVRAVRRALRTAELLVRIDPVGPWTAQQVDAVLDAGADVVMLPFFRRAREVETFVAALRGRARTSLLLETAAALVRIDETLAVGGVDEVHVGLNDLHREMGLGFMYELLAGGILDHVAARVRAAPREVSFGFGGGALLDAPHPVAPADVLREHVRLGSRAIILSRTFTGDARDADDLARRVDLTTEVARIREVIAAARRRTAEEVEADRVRIWARIREAARASDVGA